MTKIEVLQNCTVTGNNVKLPDEQLDRKVYIEVSKALNGIGGKWQGGRVAAFVFQEDPTNLLAEISEGKKRNLKKEYQFFATPKELAIQLVHEANPKSHHKVLEPSAGQGAIIQEINAYNPTIKPDCYELMEQNVSILNKSNMKFNLLGKNFFTHDDVEKYDRIIANPPFTLSQDIDHFMKMWNCLNSGGRIVCVMSTSWVKGNQKKQVEFRDFLDNVGAQIEHLKEGTFKESGTNVAATVVIVNKI